MNSEFNAQREAGEELLNENNGDYLTGMAVEGATNIMNSISSLEKSVVDIKKAIEEKKKEISARVENEKK